MTSRGRQARAGAAVLLGAQALTLAALGVVLMVRTAAGAESEAGRALTLIVVVLVFAAAGGLLTRQLQLRRAAVRTPAVLWNAFVVLTGVTLLRNGAPVVGAAVSVVGVVTLVLCVVAELDPVPDPTDSAPADPGSEPLRKG